MSTGTALRCARQGLRANEGGLAGSNAVAQVALRPVVERVAIRGGTIGPPTSRVGMMQFLPPSASADGDNLGEVQCSCGEALTCIAWRTAVIGVVRNGRRTVDAALPYPALHDVPCGRGLWRMWPAAFGECREAEPGRAAIPSSRLLRRWHPTATVIVLGGSITGARVLPRHGDADRDAQDGGGFRSQGTKQSSWCDWRGTPIGGAARPIGRC
jgi:hypothetical protein